MQTTSHSQVPDYWFIFQGDRLLLTKTETQVNLPDESIFLQIKPYLLRHHYLGKFNNHNCYCAEIDKNISLPQDIQIIPLRLAFEVIGVDWYRAAVKAYSIITWDINTQFCSRCGSKTILKKIGTYEHVCSVCELALYPRISPSMIVMIKKEDQILMARSPHFSPGAYGLIAGFVEIGESIEEAVHREVKEEVSIEINNLQYFGSQAWPFPDSLMVGFTADYVSGDIVIDNNEIEAAGWYNCDNLPGRPSSNISIAKKLIDSFIEQQKKSHK